MAAAAPPTLPLLALLALLSALLVTLLLTALLTLLVPLLLLLVAGHLLHLPLQLLSFAAEHLFLPALLIALIAIALLLGQFFLALGKLFQLLQGFIDFLGALIGGISRLVCFVLIFLRIQFEVEKAGEIAARRAATATASSGSERYLNLAESSLGAKQVLQGSLFIGERVGPFQLLQLLRCGTHGRGGGTHILLEITELLIRVAQFAPLQAASQRERLIAQLGLHAGEEFAIFRRFLF